MPTATTTATDALRGVIEEGGAGPASNQHRRSGGPTDWVQFTVASGLDPRSALGPTSSLHKCLAFLISLISCRFTHAAASWSIRFQGFAGTEQRGVPAGQLGANVVRGFQESGELGFRVPRGANVVVVEDELTH